MSDSGNDNLSPCSSTENNSLIHSYLHSRLDHCHCCEGIRSYTPARIVNDSSLSTLNYRIGTHGMFKESMISKLSIDHKLAKLTTREDSDLAIAIIDAWACIADVISFYQERIINEAFLRTATERMSILEMARSVGYELSPGVASDTLLAFKIEENSAQIEKSIIEKGTKLQSIPRQGEMPQIYETIETIEARPELNEIHARTKIPNFINSDTSILYFNGLGTELKKEDGIFIVSKNETEGINISFFAKVLDVREDNEQDLTIVNIHMLWSSKPASRQIKTNSGRKEVHFTNNHLGGRNSDSFISSNKKNFSTTDDRSGVREPGSKRSVPKSRNEMSLTQITSMAMTSGVDENDLVEEHNKTAADENSNNNDEIYVYAFRQKASIFGHDAPSYEVITFPLDGGKPAKLSNWDNVSLPIYKKVNIMSQGDPSDPNNEGNFVHYNSASPHEPIIFLDNIYENIITTSNDQKDNVLNWAIFYSEKRDKTNNAMVYPSQVSNTTEETLTEYALTGKVTGIKLKWIDDLAQLSTFRRRNTTAFVQSERLLLADSIDQTPVAGNIIELEKGVAGLHKGQVIIITGETLDETGKSTNKNSTEYRNLLGATTERIFLDRDLDNHYVRKSVRMFANVVKASHGESKREILGSGDPSKSQQSFSLKQKPLTYIKAPTPSGGRSTLEIRVDDMLWREVDNLYDIKPDEHAFMTRNKDDGSTVITFGDGKRGLKPNKGTENIVAKYRVGTGKGGLVNQNQISILIDRPLGVVSVTNPFPTTAAEDPENIENARLNAPLKVLTMDRIVSKTDFESFARVFGGIGKVLSSEVWDGKRTIVLLSVASSTGTKLDTSTTENFLKSLEKHTDPHIPFKLGSFIKKTFSLKAKIKINTDFLQEKIFATVRNEILNNFSFEKRQFGQPVSLSEIVTVIQNKDGVIAVDVDELFIDETNEDTPAELLAQSEVEQQATEQNKFKKYLPSSLPFYDNKLRKIRPAELLVVNPNGINLQVID
jgi:hypothetical protein